MKKTNLVFIVFAVLSSFFLSSCATKKSEDEPQLSVQELYTKAAKKFQDKEYKKAAALFADITYQYPYYKGAYRARIMEIYSYYLGQDYDSVIYAIENFINMYPAAKEIQYIYYMNGLAYYEQIDIPYRDQDVTKKARQAFITLISRFPRSIYTQDARIKLELIEDHLAAQEMIVGRYYINTGNILSAINRFKTIVDEYSTTSQIQEALYRLVESYTFLGMKKEAEAHAAVLHHNYPKSKWYRYSYNLIQNMPK